MILKAEQLINRLKSTANDHVNDPFVIVPLFNMDEVAESGSASIDLRLGTWFSTLVQYRLPIHHAEESSAEMKSEQSTKQNEAAPTRMHYVPFGREFILHPRSFVLAVTLEWIRLPRNLAAYVVGKSSWGRRGLIIATAIGVHPGFTGCLTLELTNVGEVPISIKPGMLICQLFVHEVRSDTTCVDQSSFTCTRLPILGRISSDPVADKLEASLIAREDQ